MSIAGKPSFKEAQDIFVSCDIRYPYMTITYRITKHWQTGVLTRHLPWQFEMMPQQFVEISRELVQEKGIKSGDKVIVSSACGKIWAIAIVTERLKPFKVMNQTIHQIGLPFLLCLLFYADLLYAGQLELFSSMPVHPENPQTPEKIEQGWLK